MADYTKLGDFNVGRVKVTIFENRGAEGSWLTASFLRLYKKDEKWKTTPRFKRDDLASLAEAATRTLERMDEKAENRTRDAGVAGSVEGEEPVAGR